MNKKILLMIVGYILLSISLKYFTGIREGTVFGGLFNGAILGALAVFFFKQLTKEEAFIFLLILIFGEIILTIVRWNEMVLFVFEVKKFSVMLEMLLIAYFTRIPFFIIAYKNIHKLSKSS